MGALPSRKQPQRIGGQQLRAAARGGGDRLERTQSRVHEQGHLLVQGVTGNEQLVRGVRPRGNGARSEEHTSELQSRPHLVCRLLLEKKKKKKVVPAREEDSLGADGVRNSNSGGGIRVEQRGRV